MQSQAETAQSDAFEVKTARQYVDHIKLGELSSEYLVAHCLSVIENTDEKIGAWAHLNADQALSEARKMDDLRRRGKPLGALHGLPVGIKDIVDTTDYPTEYGCSVFANRRPENDAAVVERLKEAGAVILGKTVSTEMAFLSESNTRNPHNPEYGPGGSSSGSAAAVAAGQVPLAIGSQTNGSTIRPASFCGVFGFKPSRGIVSRRGVLRTSDSLDQLGIFSLDLADAALLCNAISGYDGADPKSYIQPKPDCLAGFQSEPPVEPMFAWFDMPYYDRATKDTMAGFAELLEAMGSRVDRLTAPKSFEGLIGSHKLIYYYEMNKELESVWNEHASGLSAELQQTLSDAREISSDQYEDAVAAMRSAADWFSGFYNDYDAVVTLSALSEAPKYGEGTGDPICCTLWTLAGLPCLNLPLLTGLNNLPIGVQLVGAYNEDDRLFRSSRWLLETIRRF